MNFESLYRTYARDVFRFALYLSGDRAEADDITAETFARALASREPIRVPTVKAYLLMIARNVYRAGRRRANRLTALEESVADARRDPETAAAHRRELDRVIAAMQTLPEIDRAALLMRALDDLPYEEIAAALGISAGAAKVKVCRARVRLNVIRKEVP
ncbi:MAG TPA: RNA polymerase sigma factor [Vicinamibacterales bacterium]|jgi:RNA polymerase sigma-70 factor (ECF subfamily)